MMFLFEAFKVNKNMEDNPEELGERLVNVRNLVTSRLGLQNRRVDDLIAMHQEKI